MHRATGEASYLADAEKHYETGAAWGQSWDEKNAGNMVSALDKILHGVLSFEYNVNSINNTYVLCI